MSSESEVSGPPRQSAVATPPLLTRLGKVLDGPLTGLAPWIILGVFEGPGRTVWAVLAALVLSVAFVAADVVRGRTLKLLGAVNIVYFAVLLVVVNLVGPAGLDWIEVWLGEISNITLTVIAVGSIAVRMPFTLQYARDETPRELWDHPLFLRINYVITWFWAASFLVSSAVGFYGDFVLHDNNNLWTGWIIQVGAMLVAVEFTAWYPAHARARAGVPGAESPPLSEPLASLSVWFVPIGIISLVADAAPVWVGIAFIAVGVGLGAVLRRDAAEDAA